MQSTKNKAKSTGAIALVLLMASILLTLYTPVQAQPTNPQEGGGSPLPPGVTPDVSYDTIAYLSFRPNPIGVGQPLLVNVWLQPPIHVARYFKDTFEVTLTDPDGNEDVVGPFSSYYGDSTGWFEYTVDQVGTWKIKFDFLGAYFPPGNYTSEATFTLGQVLNAPLGIYYKPSSDGPYEFVVQEDLVGSWPPSPLPTDYWTQPVQIQHREWWPILGGFPSQGVVGGGPEWPADTNTYSQEYYNFVPYAQGPKSAHIAWKRQDQLGGIWGGPLGYWADDGRPGDPDIIYHGRAYDSMSTVIDGELTNVWTCYDIRTGETIFERTGMGTPDWISWVKATEAAIPGAEASVQGTKVEFIDISGGMYRTYDPWDGDLNYEFSIAPLTSATFYANGEAAPLFLSVQRLGSGPSATYRLINWTATGDIRWPDIINRRVGVLGNVSFPFSSWSVADFEAMIAVRTESITPSSVGVAYGQRIMAASLKTGQLLWNITTDLTTGLGGTFSGSTRIADHGKFAMLLNDGYWHCWDLQTGQELWKGELSSWPWGIWGEYNRASAYGMLYYPQYDGMVARDWDTGKIAWRYRQIAPYPYETVYSDGNFPFRSDPLIADGVVYIANDEHSISNPLPRGYRFHAIDAFTGEGIWSIMGHFETSAIAEGYLIATARDGYTYCFGKGKSATTVTAPKTAIPLGQSVVIEGTVMDMSPGQPGTPCVSKDSMAEWMEYIHMQQPIPANVTGVPVSLDTIDPNGNFVHIGDVTTDMSGMFKKMWTPEIPGEFTVIATFMGDESYGSSFAETAVGVTEAPEPYPEPPEYGSPEWPEYPEAPAYTAVDLAIIAAVALAIVIGLLNFWALRKRQ